MAGETGAQFSLSSARAGFRQAVCQTLLCMDVAGRAKHPRTICLQTRFKNRAEKKVSRRKKKNEIWNDPLGHSIQILPGNSCAHFKQECRILRLIFRALFLHDLPTSQETSSSASIASAKKYSVPAVLFPFLCTFKWMQTSFSPSSSSEQGCRRMCAQFHKDCSDLCSLVWFLAEEIRELEERRSQGRQTMFLMLRTSSLFSQGCFCVFLVSCQNWLFKIFSGGGKGNADLTSPRTRPSVSKTDFPLILIEASRSCLDRKNSCCPKRNNSGSDKTSAHSGDGSVRTN